MSNPIIIEDVSDVGPSMEIINSFPQRIWEITKTYLPLSISTFGGPQAHIALFYNLFVEKERWLPNHAFTEIFAIAQALPGPSSTQIAYSIALIRAGFWPGIWSFFVWRYINSDTSIHYIEQLTVHDITYWSWYRCQFPRKLSSSMAFIS